MNIIDLGNTKKKNKYGSNGIRNIVTHWIMNTKNIFYAHPILMLTILMMGTSIFVFYPYLFERQVFIFSDVGSDTKNVYYPFFISLARKLQQGDFSLWDFSYGTGVNILTRQADVGNVFTYLTCALGKGGIKYALVLIHILKIWISGYLCYFYLDTFKFTATSKIVVSYIYAFNGFIMLWGQHYFMGNASIFIILMLLSIELAFKSSKGYICTALSTFAVMSTSYYFAYMILLVSAIYAICRLCYIYSVKQVKKVIKICSGLLCAVLVGACLAAFIFIPSVYIVMSTSARLGNDTNIFDRILEFISLSYDKTTVKSIISRVFSNNLMGTEDFVGPYNYYELPQWFFSSFTLFIGTLFGCELVLDKTESIKGKIIKILGVLFVVITAFYPFVSFVFNGFVTMFFRYTYLFMPILGLCYASVLDKLFCNKMSCAKIEIFIAGLISLCVMCANIYDINTPSRNAELLGYIYLLMLVIFIMLSFLIQGEERGTTRRIICIVSLGLLVVTNVSLENFVTNNVRTATSEINPDIYRTNGNDSVYAILSELKENDNTFCRIEKTFQDISYLNDSMLQGYYGVSTYNSVINKNLIEFKNEICPEFKVTQAEGYYDFQQIVENTRVVSMLGVKYILSMEYLDNIPEYRYIKTVDNIHIYQNDSTEGIVQFYTKAISSGMFTSLEQQQRDEVIGDTVILDGMKGSVTEGTTKPNTTISFEMPTNSSHVKGHVDAQSAGWLFAAIPFEDGWKAYVDGVETEILRANFGFSAIEVNEGKHEIVFKYQTPYLKEGMLISCLGIVFLFIWCTGVYIYTKREKVARKTVMK